MNRRVIMSVIGGLAVLFLIALSKIVGFEVSPLTESSSI